MRKQALIYLGLVAVVLVALGLVVLCSAGQENAKRLYGESNVNFFFIRQLMYLGMAAVFAVVAASFNYRHFRNHPWLTVVLGLFLFGLLILVLNGKMINGSRRWLDLGLFSVQPSEFAKIAVVICVAAFLDRCSWRVGLFKNGFVFPLLIIGLFAVPVFAQPDYGSGLVIGVLGLLTMLFCGVKWRYFLIIGVLALLAIGVFLKNNPNRMARITAWWGKDVEIGVQVSKTASDNASYQARQSLVAIKNGGLFGVGLYNSMQKEEYLPEAHTDFIFAIGAEELGLFFSLGVILLFTAYFAISLYIAKHSSDRFGKVLAVGMAYLVYMQAMINIGVVCSALPTKGMALPFFSYGGTNLITVGVATGLIFSVGIRALKEKKRALLKRIVI